MQINLMHLLSRCIGGSRSSVTNTRKKHVRPSQTHAQNNSLYFEKAEKQSANLTFMLAVQYVCVAKQDLLPFPVSIMVLIQVSVRKQRL